MSLGILLIVLGALPILAGVAWLFRADPAAFIFAIATTAGVVGAFWLIGEGIELVQR